MTILTGRLAIVELLGNREIVARVHADLVGDVHCLRLDVPEIVVEERGRPWFRYTVPAWSYHVFPGSLYALRFVDEAGVVSADEAAEKLSKMRPEDWKAPEWPELPPVEVGDVVVKDRSWSDDGSETSTWTVLEVDAERNRVSVEYVDSSGSTGRTTYDLRWDFKPSTVLSIVRKDGSRAWPPASWPPKTGGSVTPAELVARKVDACARAAHEANRAYCLAIGDDSQVPWEWQRESCRKGVLGVIDGNDPEQSHESWLEEKRATGWKWGPVKDPAKKEHPCFVPYGELPSQQRHKDVIFVETVRAVAEGLGLRSPCRACEGE